MEFESIKPKFKDLVEFYTNTVQEYRERIAEFRVYSDKLEKEISTLTEKIDNSQSGSSKVEKELVVIPDL